METILSLRIFLSHFRGLACFAIVCGCSMRRIHPHHNSTRPHQGGLVMQHTQPILYRIAVTGLIAALGAAAIARAEPGPTNKQIAFAQQVSDLLLNELVAALFTEFDETTPDNVEHG